MFEKPAVAATLTACSLLAAAACHVAKPGDTDPERGELLRYVDPRIGTDDSDSPFPVPGGAGGSAYPGAVVPFGMLQLGPDTPTASPSGYRSSDTQVEQFSVTHFDGAGCPNNEDLPFLPFVGALASSPGEDWASYRAGYAKNSEEASPGYYTVTLDGDIRVELTATTRTGFVRLRYPRSGSSRFLLHAGRSATGSRSGSVEIVSPRRIRGTATAGGFCGSSETYEIHFVVDFDRPFAGRGTWLGGGVSADSTRASGVDAGAYVTFDTTSEPTVQARIGLSFVSQANAEENLAAENPGWDFDTVRESARRRWNEVLHRVEITGGSDEDRTKFYTALYHVFQSPNVASDVNGQYMGFDRAVHRADWTVYQNYSGWDIIRSWTHLISALAPEASDIVRSMVQDGIEGGLLPFWSQQSVETNVMVGDPGTVNVANAYAMGVRGFDTAAAFALMLKSANDPTRTQRWGLDHWLDLHYMDNAAIALEYAMADFAIARFADALGRTATRDEFFSRSSWWRESWSDEHGFVLPRVTPTSGANSAARIYEVEVFGPQAPASDLGPGGTATASATCNDRETPEQAINGSWDGGYSDKWCDNSSENKWWQLDLGTAREIDRVVIHHAGAGGESAGWNTQDFAIRVSTDARHWTTVADVEDNRASVSVHSFATTRARYVRLEITTAIQIRGNVGDWACQPLDPADTCGFIEGNASQYVWMVPHDLPGLFERMGGTDAAIARLDRHFTELNAGTRREFFYIGNEPEHGTPWTYNFAGAPWKTQAVVRRIVDEEFSTSPGGLPGNDDLGATSAWLVWAYLGMYPVIPGMDTLVIHGPRFERAIVHLANGNTLTIAAQGAGKTYIRGLEIDGTASSRSFVRFSDISHGATLRYSLGDAPDESWGSAEADRPSASDDGGP